MVKVGSSPRGSRTTTSNGSAINNNENEYISSSAETLSPVRALPRRSVDEVIDMLCPICEDSCSCNNSTELVFEAKSAGKRKQNASLKRKKKSLKKDDRKKTKTLAKTQKSKVSSTIIPSSSFIATKKATEIKEKEKEREKHSKSSNFEQRWKEEDLDAQYALSEYYFSEDEDTNGCNELGSESDTNMLEEYYGYTSGSDFAVETLFLASTDDEDHDYDDHDDYDEKDTDDSDNNSSSGLDNSSNDGDDGEKVFDQDQLQSFHPMFHTFTDNSDNKTLNQQTETISEQLAKITPQILAAISVAAKNYQAISSIKHIRPLVIPTSSSFGNDMDEDRPDTSLRLDEVLDTKKLALVLSTSPPLYSSSSASFSLFQQQQQQHHNHHYQQQQSNINRRTIPMDAFRRSRRNSIPYYGKNIVGALRQNTNAATCTLSTALTHNELELQLAGFTLEAAVELSLESSMIHDQHNNAAVNNSIKNKNKNKKRNENSRKNNNDHLKRETFDDADSVNVMFEFKVDKKITTTEDDDNDDEDDKGEIDSTDDFTIVFETDDLFSSVLPSIF